MTLIFAKFGKDLLNIFIKDIPWNKWPRFLGLPCILQVFKLYKGWSWAIFHLVTFSRPY